MLPLIVKDMKQLAKKIILFIITTEAKFVLKRFNPKIIAITGSVGKTSTKDATYTLLKKSLYIRKSEKSFNSEFGVPLSILGLPNGWTQVQIWLKNIIKGVLVCITRAPYPKWLVLEVGADTPGDISSIARWLRPHIVIITTFPDVPVHIEFFKDKEEIIKEKSSLVKMMRKDGLLVLNRDDESVFALSVTVPETTKVVSYGVHEEATLRIVDYKFIYKGPYIEGLEARLSYKGEYITLPVFKGLSKTHLLALLPGLLIGLENDITLDALLPQVKEFRTTPGRFNMLPGILGTTIIDDSYNASPFAVENAIETLKEIKIPGRKIFVFGDMMELGKYTEEEHKKVAGYVKGVVNMLITVGVRAKFTYDEAKALGVNAVHFNTTEEAAEYIKNEIKEGDCILFKASQSIRLEKAIKPILDIEDKEANHVLVRQDEEWMKR